MTTATDSFKKSKIVEYANADPVLKQSMERVMEPVDRNPDSYEVISAFGRDAEGRLRSTVDDIKGLCQEIAGSGVCSRDFLQRAEKAGRARAEAVRDTSVYIGTTREVLRRYNEEYIPEATKQYNQNLDPEDDLYLHDVLKRKDDFVERAETLETLRLESVDVIRKLRQFIDDPRYNSEQIGRDATILARPLSVQRKPLQLKKPGA